MVKKTGSLCKSSLLVVWRRIFQPSFFQQDGCRSTTAPEKKKRDYEAAFIYRRVATNNIFHSPIAPQLRRAAIILRFNWNSYSTV